MESFATAPPWVLALVIFGLRVVDVSLGTLRTITVVQGRIAVSVMLGFFEVLIWVTAVSQVVVNLERSLLLPLAYAAGFAFGNATGILLERRLAWGMVLVRLISTRAEEIAGYLHDRGQWATSLTGQGNGSSETIVFGTCARRLLRDLIAHARRVDAGVMYTVEPVVEAGLPVREPLPHPTGWRALFQRK